MTIPDLTPWAPRVLSLLRIMAGLLFMQHGLEKVFAFPEAFPMDLPATSPPMLAGWVELFGGLLIALGLFTRPAAFIASGTMAVAYFLVHAPQNFFPIVNGGELPIMYCFTFLYLALVGGGPLSVDALVLKKA